MDNLIAEGKAKPFIIVMDNGTWAMPGQARPAAPPAGGRARAAAGQLAAAGVGRQVFRRGRRAQRRPSVGASLRLCDNRLNMLLTGFDGARESGEGAELLGIEPLEEYATAPGGAADARAARRRPVPALTSSAWPRMQARFVEIYTALEDDARAGEPTSARRRVAARQLPHHLAAIRDIRHDLPPSFYRRLPRSPPTSLPACPGSTPWRAS